MEPSNRAVLIGLAERGDAMSSAYALRALLQEPVDEDHQAILRAVLTGLVKALRAPDGAAGTELREAVRAVAEQVGTVQLMTLACDVDTSSAFLEALLPVFPAHEVADVIDTVAAPLAAAIARGDVGADLAGWCVDVAEAGPSDAWLLVPLLRVLARDDRRHGQDERLHERATTIASKPLLVARVRDEMLVEAERDVPTRVGALRLLALSADPEHVDVIGPLVEDVGAWTHISRATLTPERLEGFTSSMLHLGVDRLVAEARSDGGDVSVIARNLASDARFHTVVAKLVGGRAAMFGFGRLLVDPRFLGALKHLVSDVDAPVRAAAAAALGRIGSEAATPYLLTGVMDRHKHVRAASQQSLRALLGDEAYQRHVDELQAEVGFIRERLQGATDWAKQALASIEGTVSGALSGVKSGAAKGVDWIGASARRLLKRQKE